MKKKLLKLLCAVRAHYLARCQQATENEILGEEPIRLLAHREVNLKKGNLCFDHVNVVFLVESNCVNQLNAILEKDTNVCYTKAKDDD